MTRVSWMISDSYSKIYIAYDYLRVECYAQKTNTHGSVSAKFEQKTDTPTVGYITQTISGQVQVKARNQQKHSSQRLVFWNENDENELTDEIKSKNRTVLKVMYHLAILPGAAAGLILACPNAALDKLVFLINSFYNINFKIKQLPSELDTGYLP
uniref:SFRICE_005332 n=1 Tax=Spodoptera frugiperda TaxID=7108 RepID=A0A2H1VJS9_SPOFR